jgi:hypothetical protein
MRALLLLVLVLCAGCSVNQHPLAHTSADDPVWLINPDRWQGENALTTPPTLPSGRIPAPQALR